MKNDFCFCFLFCFCFYFFFIFPRFYNTNVSLSLEIVSLNLYAKKTKQCTLLITKILHYTKINKSAYAGCPETGYHGSNCSVPCQDVNCQYCHIETGTCQGCKPGYQGHRCKSGKVLG